MSAVSAVGELLAMKGVCVCLCVCMWDVCVSVSVCVCVCVCVCVYIFLNLINIQNAQLHSNTTCF